MEAPLKKIRLIKTLGGETEISQVTESDIITALSFTSGGEHLVAGDCSGRAMIFEQLIESKTPGQVSDFLYLTEFDAHEKEVDPINFWETEESIVDFCFLRMSDFDQYFLSTNERTIKFWEFSKKITREIDEEISNVQMRLRLKKKCEQYSPQLQCVFPRFHKEKIHSLSLSLDNIHFLSSDLTMLCLYNISKPQVAFPYLKDFRDEQISTASFSKVDELPIYFGTSKPAIHMVDIRVSLKSEPQQTFKEPGSISLMSSRVFDTPLSIQDNDTMVIARDFSKIKIWDKRKEEMPLMSVQLEHDPSRASIFANKKNSAIKYTVAMNKAKNKVLTGGVAGNCYLFDLQQSSITTLSLNNFVNGNKVFKEPITETVLVKDYLPQSVMNKRSEDKACLVSWNQSIDAFTVAQAHKIFLFNYLE